MENNELMTMNEEINNTEITDLENYESSETSGIGLGKIVGGIALVAGAAVAGLAYKNRTKLEERKVEKLRKKGYVIYKEEDIVDEVEEVEDEEVVDTENDTK